MTSRCTNGIKKVHAKRFRNHSKYEMESQLLDEKIAALENYLIKKEKRNSNIPHKHITAMLKEIENIKKNIETIKNYYNPYDNDFDY